jgi:hypothetical protein
LRTLPRPSLLFHPLRWRREAGRPELHVIAQRAALRQTIQGSLVLAQSVFYPPCDARRFRLDILAQHPFADAHGLPIKNSSEQHRQEAPGHNHE